MERRCIGREGATEEGDGGAKTEAKSGQSMCEVGEPSAGSQPGPGEHSGRGHITERMKLAAEKHS